VLRFDLGILLTIADLEGRYWLVLRSPPVGPPAPAEGALLATVPLQPGADVDNPEPGLTTEYVDGKLARRDRGADRPLP